MRLEAGGASCMVGVRAGGGCCVLLSCCSVGVAILVISKLHSFPPHKQLLTAVVLSARRHQQY
ncbi:hypothetical protein L208DRAFT_708557 [Tricholoma matsutake]|nr:hypothetical protein L208DRAFT_708557 [Tricholoma matsutake 945]